MATKNIQEKNLSKEKKYFSIENTLMTEIDEDTHTQKNGKTFHVQNLENQYH